MNRTFTVECAEDEFGRAVDEVTGEHGYIDERSCSGHGSTMGMPGSPVHGSPGEEKVKAKEKVKVDSKGPKQHSVVKNRHRILNGGQMKTLLGGAKERRARKGSQMKAFRKMGFRTKHLEKGAGKDFIQHKGRGGAYPQSGLSASETRQ